MIAGAVNQAGFKEDRLDIKMLPQTLTGFEDVFQNTEGTTPPTRTQRELPEMEADPRLRTRHARVPGKPDRPDPEEIADEDYRQALTQASAPARPIQKAAQEEPVSLAEEVNLPELPAKALERRPDTANAPAHEVFPSMMTQVGAVAYRLAPHGVTEQESAEQAGTLPAGETLGKEETPGAAANKLENTVLFAKPKARSDIHVEANLEKGAGLQVGDSKLLTPVDILDLSREATKAAPKADQAMLTQARLDSAQARNELMMQLGQTAQSGTANSTPSPGQPVMGGAIAQAMPMPLPIRPADIGAPNASVFSLSQEDNAVPGLSPTTGAATAATTLGNRDAASRAEQIIQRIVEQARWMIRNNRSEVTFKLQPEHLGEVHLKVRQADGTLRVDMTVDNQGVKHLVESRMQELHNHLQEQQLAQGQFQFNVDVRQGDGFRQAPEFALSNPQREAAGLAAETHEPASASARTRPVWGRAGSGIYA